MFETQSVTNTVTRREIIVGESFFDATELNSLVDIRSISRGIILGITAVGENARQLPAGRQVLTITGMPQFKKDIIKELLGIWIVSIIILSCEHVPIIITGLVIAMARSPMKIRVSLGCSGRNTRRNGRNERRIIDRATGEVIFGNIIQRRTDLLNIDFSIKSSSPYLQITILESLAIRDGLQFLRNRIGESGASRPTVLTGFQP